MKTNRKLAVHCTVLGLLLSAIGTLCSLPAHAQYGESSRVPITPEAQEAFRQSYVLSRAAAASIHAGQYAQAETEARQAVALDHLNGVALEILPAALEAQGKDQEASQAYQSGGIEGKDGPVGDPDGLLPYALLLLKSGQWEHAVAAYNKAISDFDERDLVRRSSHFSPNVTEPTALAVAIHVAHGSLYYGTKDWAGESQHQEAMSEYQKALLIEPDSNIANYYYGQGWQQLSPEERTKIGTVQQARAALQKAVKYGKGDVKQAAKKALQIAMNTK